ncbi:GNAT family N-acetyltransferase [Paractinoplanes atraurantiacus]|uniref:Acetyltransferase (GNAT) family protein n=1 Tax=Paractinoplanes atraurantiacus TaxID=1036182 RepID=A0A285F154_9ACTN|nr:GNAT family N-acetyltransferase [Actinoplanes atraurantiacus]SNY04783.1 Acetyltransferase (GNAT) family protein [Actinoplanes atraurantiacus]
MRVSIEPFDSPADGYRIRRAVHEHDVPDIPFMTEDAFKAGLIHPPPGLEFERYLGLLDGEPVGYLELEVFQLDNLSSAEILLEVLPEHRRQGVGRALYQRMLERGAAHGRKHLIGSTVDRHPDGTAFATAMGAVAGLEDTRSRLDLTRIDAAHHAKLREEALAHAEGYRVIDWLGVPADEIIDDVAYLESRLMADAPTGDIAWEAEKIDAERLRADELARQKRGRLSYCAAALRGDKVVAWTVIAGELAQPAQAWQQTTLVDPDHRGHRLGMLVKLANLDNVRRHRPGIEAIDTFNASQNEYMLRINRALGFRAVDISTEWQHDL